jgi:hypothetical protein
MRVTHFRRHLVLLLTPRAPLSGVPEVKLQATKGNAWKPRTSQRFVAPAPGGTTGEVGGVPSFARDNESRLPDLEVKLGRVADRMVRCFTKHYRQSVEYFQCLEEGDMR